MGLMQALFDAGIVSICLAHGRRMGMLRYTNRDTDISILSYNFFYNNTLI